LKEGGGVEGGGGSSKKINKCQYCGRSSLSKLYQL